MDSLTSLHKLCCITGVVVATACAVGCSSSSAPVTGPDDASSPTHEDATDGKFAPLMDAKDAGSDAARGCYAVTGSGTKQLCTILSTGGKQTCASGTKAGTCPSANLYGCCVFSGTDAGPSGFTATCYYSDAGGQAANVDCETMSYEGIPAAWDPISP